MRHLVCDWAGQSELEPEPIKDQVEEFAQEDEQIVAPMSFSLFDRESDPPSSAAAFQKHNSNKRQKLAVQTPKPISPMKGPASPSLRGNGGEEPELRVSAQTGKAGKKKTDLMQKAVDTFEKVQSGWSNESIWGGKLRKRGMESAIKNLSSCSSALAPYLAECADSSRLAEAINDYCDKLQTRFQVLAQLRQDPFVCVDAEADVDNYNILLSMSTPLLSNLLLFIAQEAVKAIDQAGADSPYFFFCTVIEKCASKIWWGARRMVF